MPVSKAMHHLIIFHLLLCICMPSFLSAQNPLPKVNNGTIERIKNFQSKYITSRNIDIWLPDGYSDERKYAVLYMHDGQMLFDPSMTWNKTAWDVDDVASNLFYNDVQIKKFIVVGIWNGGVTRHSEYFPQKPFEKLKRIEKDTAIAQLQRAMKSNEVFKPHSDDYLQFIVKELKPYIDRTYSVFTDRDNTFIAGSSMGGLISMYAMCEYPKVFGGAACMSTHWIGSFSEEHNPVPNSFIMYLKRKLPNPKNHQIYFDCGDQTLDAMYPIIQKEVDKVMITRGYNAHNWKTMYFPGDDHSEKSWNKRLSIPLTFLFGQ